MSDAQKHNTLSANFSVCAGCINRQEFDNMFIIKHGACKKNIME